MLHKQLYKKVLLDPVRNDPNLNKLVVVSGYATAAMAFHHLSDLSTMNRGSSVKVNLICGMPVLDGISISNHEGFCKLVNHDFPDRFSCSYIYRGLPVHSKLYLWCEDETPREAFLGSANYTQSALCLAKRREVITSCVARSAFNYCQSLVSDSITCVHGEVSEHVCLYIDKKQELSAQSPGQEPNFNYSGLEHIAVSLLMRGSTRHAQVGARSGLNWGQRPEEGRNPNQAYIGLPSTVYRTGFFPPRKTHFTILTDDSKVLVCTRAQDAGKGIHTPHDNSILGTYFRNRLGLASGTLVTANHLRTYGRTDIDFYKIDVETYYLDFSVR